MPKPLTKASPNVIYQGYGNKYYYYDETLYGVGQTQQRPVSETYGDWQSYFTRGLMLLCNIFQTRR